MTAEPTSFVHAALIVDSDDSLRVKLLPSLRWLVDQGEAVLMVVGPGTERVVRAELGVLAERLEWAVASGFYQRLGFTFDEFRRYLAAQHRAGRRVHVIAEPDVVSEDGPVDRTAAYLSYESMCNVAYADYGCPVTCLWDSRRHAPPTIENVRSVHNHEVTVNGHAPNAGFVTTDDYLAGRNDVRLPAPPVTTALDLTLTHLGALSDVRAAVTAWARVESFDESAASDVVLAVDEVATNGLVHGEAPVRLRAWRRARTLFVQVDDAGGRSLPPDAGYRPPPVGVPGGRGMWLARQLADVVTVHTGGGVTSVRLHFPHEVTHRNPPS